MHRRSQCQPKGPINPYVKYQICKVWRWGYTEDENVISVIRSIHSGLRVKSILEMKRNLAFATLIWYVKHHHKEKISTDLCTQLTSKIQMSNGGQVDFTLWCIKLNEKLIVVPKTSEEIKCDKVLVSHLVFWKDV